MGEIILAAFRPLVRMGITVCAMGAGFALARGNDSAFWSLALLHVACGASYDMINAAGDRREADRG